MARPIRREVAHGAAACGSAVWTSPDSARASRVLAIASSRSRTFLRRLFRRDAEINTRSEPDGRSVRYPELPRMQIGRARLGRAGRPVAVRWRLRRASPPYRGLLAREQVSKLTHIRDR